MAFAKKRTEFLNQAYQKNTGEIERRLISNGFVPQSIEPEYTEQSQSWQSDTIPDTDIDFISNANWFALHPEKIAGKMEAGTGFLMPVLTKGTLQNVIDTINNNLGNEAVKDMPTSAEKIIESAPSKEAKEAMRQGIKESKIIFATIPPQKEKPKMAKEENFDPKIEASRNDLAIIEKLNLIEDPKNISRTQTVADTLLKYNPGLTEDEIRAWVYHKRRFGNPMRGWEKYFMEGGTGVSIILKTTKLTTAKDNKFADTRTFPENTTIGTKTKFKHEYQGVNYVICKTLQGELLWLNASDVEEVKYRTSESQTEIDRLVNVKALLFDGSEYYPYPVYLFGNIYEKIKQLADAQAEIVAKYGQDQYDEQISKVREYIPKLKSFRDPIKGNRPHMLCLSEFANDAALFGVLNLHEESGVKIGYTSRGRFYEQSEKISLFDAFKQWLAEAVRDIDLKNTTRADIAKYYFSKAVKWPKDDNGKDIIPKNQQEELVGNARLAAEDLFSEFLASALTYEDSIALDVIWNEKYNAFTNIIQFVDKVPIAFHGSSYFKDGVLDVKPAQRQGLAYLQLTGSGCLAYDVGFGKTLTGILNLAQLVSQGAVERPLIVVPKPTYKNWLKELFGYYTDGEKVEFTEFAGSTYHYGAFSGIEGVKLNDWYNLSGNHYKRLLEQNGGDINKLVPKGTITVVSYKGFEQMGFSRNISTDLFDSIARVIMQKDVMEGQQTNEKKNAKEQVSFYQKVQGWLGLGNKNALIDVDTCGFDHLTVDEAHNFKNAFPSCGKDPATGRKLFDISAGQSTRAVKMFFITNYIQLKHGKNVALLTATPFTNSPLEIYSMLSYVGLDTLNQYNLFNIKKFFEQFVLQTIEYAIDAKGEIITKPVIKSFQNLKLLQTILFNHFHYKADPKEAGVVRPCKIDLPNKEITTYLEMNEMQRSNQVLVKAMAKSVSRQDPGAGLRAMAMSLDNAFSPYLMGKQKPESSIEFVDNSPKIKYAVECIRSVKEWHEGRGEECSGIVLYSNRGLDYFDYIKDFLINEIGFRDNISYDEETISEVEILSGGGSEADEDRKELIKDAFNAGVVKIIIGTGTIREGINLQKRGTVLIDLYPEWNPTDIVQLKGRIWRQGNMFGYIRFVMPLVINSMDNFINQKLDEKGKRVANIWAPIGDSNIMENSTDLDPAEIKYQLIDDASEKFKMKFETLKNEMQRTFEVLNDNKKTLYGVQSSIETLKDSEDDLYTNMLDKKPVWQQLLGYLKTINLPQLKAESAKTATDIDRTIKNVSELIDAFQKYSANRYDIGAFVELVKMIKNRNYEIFTDYSSQGQKIRTEVQNILDYDTFKIYSHDYSRLIESFGEVRRAEKSVLNAYNKTWMDDFNDIIVAVDKKIEAIKAEAERVQSDEYKESMIAQIEHEMEVARNLRGDLREQVERFASLNHTLSYGNDNTDKENCPIPTGPCCENTGVKTVWHDKEMGSEPVSTTEEAEQKDERVKFSPEALYFIPAHQLKIVRSNMEFNDARIRVNAAVAELPKTYETEGTDLDNKIAYLHYFYGNMDWYIFEKDKGTGDGTNKQLQAFGMASFGQDKFEAGYIDISEFVKGDKVELDLYFEPKKWSAIQGGAEDNESEEIAAAIEMLKDLLPDLKGKEKKEAKEAIELLTEML